MKSQVMVDFIAEFAVLGKQDLEQEEPSLAER